MSSQAAAHFLQLRIQYSSIAFICYDYVLTFPDEVKYMWGRKISFYTLLYICCRYALVANVLYALAKMDKLGATCDVWYKVIGVLSVLGRAAVLAVITKRTSVVYGCNRRVRVSLMALGLMCIILDFSQVPGLRCEGSTANRIVDTLLSILMVVFEFTAAILLAVRTMREFCIGRTWRYDGRSLYAGVLKQGVVYFASVSFFTMAAVVLNFRAPAGSFFQRLPNAYTLPLSCTLSARFLLQLREWQDKTIIMMGDDGQRLTAQDQHPATLTELRATALVDSRILSDFGDGPSSQIEDGSERETGWYMHGENDSSERGRCEGIPGTDGINVHEPEVRAKGNDTEKSKAENK